MSTQNPDDYNDDLETYDESFDDMGDDSSWEAQDEAFGSLPDDGEVEDDFADDPSDDDRQGGPVQRKKKGGLFNLIVIAVILAAGGGFFVMQMGGSSQAPAPAEQAAQQPGQAVTPPAPEQPAQAQVPSPASGAPDMMMGGSDLETGAAMPPEPRPALAEVSDAPSTSAPIRMPSAQDVLKPAPDLQTEALPVPQEVLPTSTAEPIDALTSPAMPAQPVSPVQAVPVVPAMDAAALQSLQDSMQQVLNRLGMLESELQTLKSQSGSVTGSDDQIRTDVQKIGKTVETLQKSIADLKAAPSRPVISQAIDTPAQVTPKPQILGPADDDRAAVAAPAPAHSQAAQPAAPATHSWVLRGAQPGQAMVARQGQSDTQTVRTGDSLPGVGRIKAIEYRDGRWVVEGTQGRITQ